MLVESAQNQTNNSHPAADLARDGCSYKSPWKLAIYQALLSLGMDAFYQDVANWISERLPQTPLPKYCHSNNHGQVDLGYAVRQQSRIRNQFQKDLNKVKSDLRGRQKP